jgi:hypothetical protein
MMMDLNEIRRQVVSKHNDFIKEYGLQLDKVGADHRLQTQVIMSRIASLLEPFVDTNIIDDPDFKSDGGYTQIILKKKGLFGQIHLITDGKILFVKEHNIKIHFGLQTALAKEYNEITNEFDWTKFAVDLLDAIHNIIYGRSEAVGLRFFGYNV